LAGAMGGSLDPEESGSSGSVFRLHLPLAPDAAQSKAN
jgi:signal transduction histidine kinase